VIVLAKSQSLVGGVGSRKAAKPQRHGGERAKFGRLIISRKDTEVQALRRRVWSGVLVLAKTQTQRLDECDIKIGLDKKRTAPIMGAVLSIDRYLNN
jgi:hypothetical protein